MSLYKRGGVWWYDFTIDGARYRGSTKQRAKAAAVKVEDRERERAKLGEVSRPVPTLRDAADRWFSARIAGRKSASTVAFRLEIALRLLGPDRLVTEIDSPEIEDAIQRRRLEETRQGRAPTNATVNRDLIDTTLRPILRYCKKVLKVAGMPEIEWTDLKLTEPKGRSRTFTAAELSAWRAELPAWHRPVFDFIATYGPRLREAFFPLDAYDPTTGALVIRERKNGLPHRIRLQPDEMAEMNARYGRAKEAGLATVWFRETKRGLAPIGWRGFQSASQTALRRAGVADARPVHDLRHHAATAFLRLPGANMKAVQKLLGHESPASSARYAHVSDDDVFDIMRHTTGTIDTEAKKEHSPNNGLGPDRTGT